MKRMNEVQPVFGGGAKDERQAEDVGQVELEIEEPHEARRPHQAEGQRQQSRQRLAHAAQHGEGQRAHHDDGVERALLLGALHQANGLVGDERCAGDVVIDRTGIGDEALGALAVPG
jgi:hypothetical protein